MSKPSSWTDYEGPGAYHIQGVDKTSGFDTDLVINASSKANAKVKAELQGMVVTQMRPAASTLKSLMAEEKKKNNKTAWVRLAVAGFFFVSIAICCSGIGNFGGSSKSNSSSSSSPTSSRSSTPEGFNPWDGSHIELTRRIKADMNDPDSYTHVKTLYVDKGDHLVVSTEFRGKNAFGGTVKQTAYAKVSKHGSLIELVGYTKQ